MQRLFRPLGLFMLLALGALSVLVLSARSSSPPCWSNSPHKDCSTTTTTTTPTTTAPPTVTTTTTTPTTTAVQQPATVSTSLLTGATISGTYTWTVKTSGDAAAVEFWASDASGNKKLATIASNGTGTFVYNFDTTKLPNGLYRFGIVEVDSAGVRYPDENRQDATISNTPTSSGTISWRGDYETGDWSQFGGAGNLQCDVGTPAVESSVVRQGRYAASYSVPPYDGSTRSRCQQMRNPDSTYGNKGQENWFAFSFMVANGSTLNNGGCWNNIVSFHHSNINNTLIAPDHFCIFNSNGVWTLYVTAYGGTWNNSGTIQYQRSWQLGQVKAGQWYDLIYHVKWSPDPTIGFLEVWVNGQQIVPLTHAATLYTSTGSTDNESVYLKVGYDGGGSAGSTTVYQDAAAQATDYTSAASVTH